MSNALLVMLLNRPAVVANVTAFLILALAERGALRTMWWLATGTAIGWLMEFSSTRTGFPFGHYAYHPAAFANEWSAGGVPLFASLSFAALTYFGYSAACTLLAPLHGEGLAVRRVPDPHLATSWRVLLLATVLITWMDVVIDPLTLLGRYWHLGDLYHYESLGAHFGVPLSNYAGWLFTSCAIVGANQLLDRALRRSGAAGRPLFSLPFQPFWSIGAQAGTYVYMTLVALYLLASRRVPDAVPVGAILASGLLCTAAYALLVTWSIRRGRRRGRRLAASGDVSAAPAARRAALAGR
jgi:uncharacterized membrane protein